MSGERKKPKSLELWLKFARSDLHTAETDIPEVLYEIRCFHAQQAVEKSLKAILIASGIEIRKTHKITEILNSLPKEISIPHFVKEAEKLTEYAITFRYPRATESITREDWLNAVDLAKQVFEWAEETIKDIG
ncbi:MAG: HEPN domain-containing protein [candidate division Zixibacteria bacterium]|nr:HEPN domain-containing protein [Candidatus Tariuqbacter arcticus]